MKIEQLIALIEVAKVGSVNKAAERLFMSQQNLNKTLKAMEHELGQKLLIYSPKGVQLTNSGKLVLESAQKITKEMDILQQRLAAYGHIQALQGRININISPPLNTAVLPYAYQDFTHCYPEVQIYAVETYRDTIIEQVSQNPDQLGLLCVSSLTANYEQPIPSNVEITLLKKYPMYIMMSAAHPLADFKYLSIKTIAPYPLVVYEAGGMHGVCALPNEIVLSSNNYFLCNTKLQDIECNAVAYSLPIYKKRGLFERLVHIPIGDRNAVSLVYMVTNKSLSSEKRFLLNLFIQIFQEHL